MCSVQLIHCQKLACENLFLQIVRPTPRDQWVNTLALQDNKVDITLLFCKFCGVFFHFDIFYSGHGVLAEDSFECIYFEIKITLSWFQFHWKLETVLVNNIHHRFILFESQSWFLIPYFLPQCFDHFWIPLLKTILHCGCQSIKLNHNTLN